MPEIQEYVSSVVRQVVTIGSTQTTSGQLSLKGLLLTGVRFGAGAFTGTALTLEESTDASVWTPIRIKDASTDFSVTPVPSKTIVFENAFPLSVFEYVRFVSNAAEAAQRTFTLICRPA